MLFRYLPKGFTLVELMVVIAIVGILVAVGFGFFGGEVYTGCSSGC